MFYERLFQLQIRRLDVSIIHSKHVKIISLLIELYKKYNSFLERDCVLIIIFNSTTSLNSLSVLLDFGGVCCCVLS